MCKRRRPLKSRNEFRSNVDGEWERHVLRDLWIEAPIVNLVIHIPHGGADEAAVAFSLAQQAPSFTMEWRGGDRMSIAIFPSLPTGIDLAVQLVGEAIQISGAWASVNARALSSLAKLWQRLNCYRDSLNAPDRGRYCLEKTAFFNTLVGCEAHRCPVPCQFICTPCMRMSQDESPVDVERRFEAAMELAEIAWCPNLKMPGFGSQVGRVLLTIEPGSGKDRSVDWRR